MLDSKGNRERFKHTLQEDKFKKVSPLLERERNIDISIITSIQDLFWEFHFLRRVGENIEPFDPQRIESHLRLLGKTITTWEYRLVMEMDLIFRASVIKNRS